MGDDARLDDLFSFLAVGAPTLSKERLLQIARPLYKVIKPTVISTELSVKSKNTRRLEENEVLEVYGLATTEEETGVKRVRCRAIKDDAEGWVSVSGNKGSVFVGPCPTYYYCVKEAIMTDGLKIACGKTVRKVAVGEIVSALGPMMKDEESEILRLEVTARKDQ